MATDTLNMNAVGMPVANGVETTGASNAKGSASSSGNMPAWINAKEGPGAVVMDVLRQPSVRKALPFIVIFMLLMSVAVFFTSMKPTPYRPLVLIHAGMREALPVAPLALAAPVVSRPEALGMPTAFMFKVSVAISVSQSSIKPACS